MDDSAAAPPPLTRWVGVLGVFVAPTTIVTGLCFYFGYASAKAELGYFGVDSDIVGYTSTDYLLRSVSVLYAPLVALVLTWAAALWAAEFARRAMTRHRRSRTLRVVARVLIALGAVSTVRGILGVISPIGTPSAQAADVITPVVLVIGLTVVALGYWILSGTRDTPRAIASAERVTLGLAAAVVVLALFWIANIFATAYGTNEAERTAATLWTKESTIALYTTEPLDAPRELIDEKVVANAPSPRYRYQCFRGLATHGDRWVLVPARWTPEFGYVAIIDIGTANQVSITRLKGIAHQPAANWDKPWQCPEVASSQPR